jgi:hypothetical protein
MIDETRRFDCAFAIAATVAAAVYEYRPPDAAFVLAALDRIPVADREEIGRGLADGTVDFDGHLFRLPRLPATKGPYKLFGRDTAASRPAVHWEYYLQVAEYLRTLAALPARYDVGFEDGLMDVSVRRNGVLLWYIEVKERTHTSRGC